MFGKKFLQEMRLGRLRMKDQKRFDRLAARIAPELIEAARRSERLCRFNDLLGLQDGQTAEKVNKKEPERVQDAIREAYG